MRVLGFLLLTFSGCCQTTLIVAPTDKLTSFDCNLRSSSRLATSVEGAMPVALSGISYERVTTRSTNYSAAIPWADMHRLPNAIYVCGASNVRELECSHGTLREETHATQGCTRVKKVRWDGAQLLVDCGTLEQRSDDYAETSGEIYRKVILL